MRNGKNRRIAAFAASMLLAEAPAFAAKPPPPPPPPTDPWEGCTPWGPVIYGVDCCDYPELQIPCQGPNPPLPLVVIPLEAEAKSAGD